jgi:hypothetical protein
MKHIPDHCRFFILLLLVCLVGCNESPDTSAAKQTDTSASLVKNDDDSMPSYDPAMDGLIVGAKFSKKLADTLNVKMYTFEMKPGDSAELHSHPDHAVYVLEGGKLAVTFQGAGRQIMDMEPGMAFVGGPLSDAAKNVGNSNIKLLIVDIYRPRGK